MIDARLSHEVPSQVRRQRHRRQTPLRSKAVLPPRSPSGGQLQLRQARIPSWGLPLTDLVEPQLVLDGHRQQKLHSGLVRYCISKAPDIARFVRPDRCARSFGLAWRHPRDAILYTVPFFVSLRLPIFYRQRRLDYSVANVQSSERPLTDAV
jgi:hypothetical protein